DGGNLNRLFPGSAESGPTAAIAHYVATELFPLSDLVIDLHSGGSSLEYLPMSLARHGRTKGEAQAIRDLITCFGAPYGMITDGSGGGAGSTLYAAAEQQGIPALTAELGGGPTLSEYGLSIAENGIRRVLGQYGIASGLDCADSDQTLLCRPVGTAGNLYAPLPGLFEPFVKVGERVVPGQRAGRLHRLDDALGNPVDLSFSAGGVVCFRRFLTLTSTGDALFGLMTELET
ncbi:succinylglutamate desuccinylase, partial [Mesorhizobium sp. M1A.F.Ca.IN.022.05.2.1]